VSTVESLVRGDSRELRTAERDAATARASADATRDRLAVASELRRLQDSVRASDNADPKVSEALDQLVQALLAGSPADAEPAPAALPAAREQ
jgi:hypothetical protein